MSASEIKEYQSLCEKAQALALDLTRVLKIRTAERDKLLDKILPQGSNIVHITPTILEIDRRKTRASVLQKAQRKLRRAGYGEEAIEILQRMTDEDP